MKKFLSSLVDFFYDFLPVYICSLGGIFLIWLIRAYYFYGLPFLMGKLNHFAEWYLNYVAGAVL